MRSTRGRVASSLFAASMVLTAAPLAAQGLTGFNVFSFGSFSQSNTEVNGRLAVGGAFNSTNSSVGISLANSYAGPAVVVGGATTWNNGQIFHRDAYMAGSRALNGFSIPGGVVKSQATALPVNFTSEYSRLTTLSNSYSALTTNSTTTVLGNQLFFYGTKSGANVFNVTQAQLAAATGGYQFYSPANSSMIINVVGISNGQFFANTGFNFCTGASSATSFNGCSQGDNNSPPALVSDLLWNVNATAFTSVSFGGSTRGSFLAPNVGITATYGSCIGDYVAASFNSNCEFYNDPYNGYVGVSSVVPEPSTFAMALAGLAVFGVIVRRRKGAKRV